MHTRSNHLHIDIIFQPKMMFATILLNQTIDRSPLTSGNIRLQSKLKLAHQTRNL